MAFTDGNHPVGTGCLKTQPAAAAGVKLQIVAVIPRSGGRTNGFHGRGCNPGNPLQLFLQDGTLGSQLGFVGQVLVMAAPAFREMRTAGLNALRAGLQDFYQAGAHEIAFFFHNFNQHALSGEAEWHKYCPAIRQASHGVSAVCQVLDLYFQRHGVIPSPPGRAGTS